MPRTRPATNPLSYHKHTAQYYVTRAGRRIYLGTDRDLAMEKYHRLALGLSVAEQPAHAGFMTLKELANRFLEAQQANWRNPTTTATGYRGWLGRFIADHPGLRVEDFTVEMFAAWKLSLRRRKYSPDSINHFLGAVKAIFRFAEDASLIDKGPHLRRVKKESAPKTGSNEKRLYTQQDVQKLVDNANPQERLMVLLALNCGFGPKDIQDLVWADFDSERVTLPRSKTGVCQTFLLWPETLQAFTKLHEERAKLITRLAKRNRPRTDAGRVFVTKYWRPWSKDAVSHRFRKLCDAVGVPCYGFYRLRHCASTAISLVANPHVQRRFMRHSQLQQQVTYTHTPDSEVDTALMRARANLLGASTVNPESNPEQAGAA